MRVDDNLPSNATARNTLAQVYSQLGASHAAIAAKAGGTSPAEWRAARDAYQRSLDIFTDMKSKGTLNGADAGKIDEISREIAKCTKALGE
jgi:hypothetical protein